jgi:hypothetical protein
MVKTAISGGHLPVALPKSSVLSGASWQLQTAKARFGEVFRLTLGEIRKGLRILGPGQRGACLEICLTT